MTEARYGELINKAVEVALNAHSGQLRKASGRPYIIHPIEVGIMLSNNTDDQEIIAAGILHDTLEDTSITYEFLVKKFGKRVAELVVSASEELIDRKNKPWKERKEHTILFLVNAPQEVKLIACADKLSNIKSFIRSYHVLGEDIWSKFNSKNREDHKWYYEGIVNSLNSMKDMKIYKELVRCVNQMFK